MAMLGRRWAAVAVLWAAAAVGGVPLGVRLPPSHAHTTLGQPLGDRVRREIDGDPAPPPPPPPPTPRPGSPLHALDFMKKFGYVENKGDNDTEFVFTRQALEEALERVQEFGGIPKTGKLDEATVKLMETPRCGLPDLRPEDIELQRNAHAHAHTRRKRYIVGSEGWRKRRITYYVANWSPQLGSKATVQRELRRAFDAWTTYSRLEFTEKMTQDADIIIFFASHAHGDGYPFDYSGGILAHAFYPYEFGPYGGDIHFDESEKWITANSSTDDGLDFFTVAVHELGHSLGLSHSPVDGSIMYPYYMGFNERFALHYDDVMAMWELYIKRKLDGDDEYFNTTTTTTTTTTKPTTTDHQSDAASDDHEEGKTGDDGDDDDSDKKQGSSGDNGDDYSEYFNDSDGDGDSDDDDKQDKDITTKKKDDSDKNNSDDDSKVSKNKDNDNNDNDGDDNDDNDDDDDDDDDLLLHYHGDYETVEEHQRRVSQGRDHVTNLPSLPSLPPDDSENEVWGDKEEEEEEEEKEEDMYEKDRRRREEIEKERAEERRRREEEERIRREEDEIRRREDEIRRREEEERRRWEDEDEEWKRRGSDAAPTPPSAPSTPLPSIPDLCEGGYDAMALLRQELFIFKGQYLWRYQERGRLVNGYPAPIRTLFPSLPAYVERVSAVYERRRDGNIIFFIGKYFYVHDGNKLIEGSPRPLTDLGLPPLVTEVTAAFYWPRALKTYFFTRHGYFRYNETSGVMDAGYPKAMDKWHGLPEGLDAVFTWRDGQSYFLKDSQYWKYDNDRIRPAEGYPQDALPFWTTCPATPHALTHAHAHAHARH